MVKQLFGLQMSEQAAISTLQRGGQPLPLRFRRRLSERSRTS